MLLPKIVPMIKFPFFFFAAVIITANSGREVPIANNVIPTISAFMFSKVAMVIAEVIAYFEEKIITAKEIINIGIKFKYA